MHFSNLKDVDTLKFNINTETITLVDGIPNIYVNTRNKNRIDICKAKPI